MDGEAVVPEDPLAWSRLRAGARARRVRGLLGDPGALVRSMQLSRRVGGAALDFPVLAGPSSRLVCDSSSQIELGGRLFLGYWPSARGGRQEPTFGSRPAKLVVGPEARFATGGWVLFAKGAQVAVRKKGVLEIGEGTFFNADTRVLVRQSVTIGSDCAIAWNAMIMDTDEHAVTIAGELRPRSAPVTIGDHVWIGTRALILKGVNVGDGAVVAAQSVVTRDVPERTVVAGSPARVVRTDVEWW